MKKKVLILLSAVTFIGNSIQAQVVYGHDEYDYVQALRKKTSTSVKPVQRVSGLTDNTFKYRLSGFADNWFTSLQGGFVSFLGNPISHTDFKGRTKGTFEFGIGKWHSPYFGTRLVYQGVKFIDSQKTSQSFGSYHADLLLNVSSFFRPSFDVPVKWNISPYLGAGFVRHNHLNKNFFALSYGIWGNYHISKRLCVSATLGGTMTYENFDGYGEQKKFGDNLLLGSIGMSIGIGHLGWKPKEFKSAVLTASEPSMTMFSDDTTYPRNNYRGLKSLQERIANGSTETTDSNEHQGIETFDAPILFFFKKNSTVLIDNQQKVNIKEIAGAVKEYDLKVRIVGAADSKTGTPSHNRKLSVKRCKYIAKQLIKAGVPKSKMMGVSQGGINIYKPYTANRHTCVILYK